MMEKETWYRQEKKKEEDNPEDWELPGDWKRERERGEKKKADSRKRGDVLPHTYRSELAGDMRRSENNFEETTVHSSKEDGLAGHRKINKPQMYNNESCL